MIQRKPQQPEDSNRKKLAEPGSGRRSHLPQPVVVEARDNNN